uniref:Expansin-like EG45 domain-containing protein n=1 Tax=Rhabditophanes sp. KR3021 TaxID=114890 RepID=A0AC35U5Z8_9BILA
MTTAQSSEVYGRVAGEACADCPGVSYYPGVTNPLVTGTTKTAINNYNCVSTGLKMCICTDEEKCYSADDDNMVITLYPYCGTPTTCVVYGLLNGDAENSAFVDGQNTKVYSANDGIDENFDFRPVTSGAFPKVKSVSCGVCPPVSECLADATNP